MTVKIAKIFKALELIESKRKYHIKVSKCMKDLCDFSGTEKLDAKMFNSIQVTEEQGLDDSDYRL